MNTSQDTGQEVMGDSVRDSRRKWLEPKLPPAPRGLSDGEAMLRGVLQNMIDSEKSYVSSISHVASMKQNNAFMRKIRNSVETKAVFEIADEILQIHKAFNIALEEELRKIYDDGSVAKCLNLFWSDRVLEVYSNYINNCEVALATVQKTSVRNTLRGIIQDQNETMHAYLCSAMIKPVQRYPQIILITKDILKYIPNDLEAKLNLQETLTGIDTVAFRLNERTRYVDQYRRGRHVALELPSLHLSDENACLLREDYMNELCPDKNDGRSSYRSNKSQKNTSFCWKKRRLYLMKNNLIMVDTVASGSTASKYWQQRLEKIELTTSKDILDALTGMLSDGTLGKPPTDHSFHDMDILVADINEMRHDTTVLNKIKKDLKALKRCYKIEPQVDDAIAALQKMTHDKEYQLLQVIYDSCVFIYDTERMSTFTLWVHSPQIKQEWCADFLLAKLALDPVNSPSWCKLDPHEHTDGQTALFLKHVTIKPRTQSGQRLLQLDVKCAVCVKLPHGQHEMIEHLWVCSSSASTGHVSIVPMYSEESAPIETFTVTDCNIICVERVPHTNERGTTGDSVWMATSDSEILVFVFSASSPDAHMTPIHVLKPGRNVVTMTYIHEKVFCGTSDGHVLVYNKDGVDKWSNSVQIPFGMRSSVLSIICVGDSVWAGCGEKINLIDRKTCAVTSFQKVGDPDLHVQFLVRAGVGVWVSFHGRPKLVLFHGETKVMLQELSVESTVDKFLSEFTDFKVTARHIEVTSLVATLGSLWIGTNVGIILTYPVTRLRDGIPRINQRPQIARYGHSRPIRFLFPLRYDPVSGVSIREYQTAIALVEHEHETEPQQDKTEVHFGTKEVCLTNCGRKSNRISLNPVFTTATMSKPLEGFADVPISNASINRIYSSLLRNQITPCCTGSDTIDTKGSVFDMSESASCEMTASQCNTMIVVSGGNGFMDWKAPTQQDLGTQDPTLIFWIYKL